MDSDKLLDCPFCGSEPKVNQYPTFIKIFCAECTKVNRNVNRDGEATICLPPIIDREE